MDKTKLKAFVRYGDNNKLVSSVILLRTKRPAGKGWDEVPASLCCSQISFPDVTNRRLKAFAKYDKKGFIIPSSLTVRESKPKKGTWKELPYDRCCTFYNVVSVSVSPATANLGPTDTLQLTATVSPTNASDKTVTWSSSDEAIATVSSTGLVTGVAYGDVTITATTNSGGKTATSSITVEEDAVTSVTVDPTIANVEVGGTQQLTTTVVVTGAEDDSVTYTSSDEAIATVSATGLVTLTQDAEVNDTVTITATSVADGTKSDTCVITVVAVPAVNSVTVTPATVSLAPEATQQLTTTVDAVGGADDSVVYTSSDDAQATVNSTGLITVVTQAAGEVTITATSVFDNTKSDTCVVTVTP